MRSTAIRYIKGLTYYLRRGDFKGFCFRILNGYPRSQSIISTQPFNTKYTLRFHIVTVPHTLFIANTFAERMRFHNIDVTVTVEMPRIFDSDYFLIFGAHQFLKLPPKEKTIIFQMEQHVIERWFQRKYLNILRKSYAVIEFADSNIPFLAQRGIVYPHIYKIQIGSNYLDLVEAKSPKSHDVLFYGDSFSSPRRARMLSDLSKKFSITVINDKFGEPLWEELKKHKILLNLHYQDKSLLETPRIFEALSHGLQVVSEDAVDSDSYTFPSSLVSFIPSGDTAQIAIEMRRILQNGLPDSGLEKSYFESNLKEFNFQIDRFLVGKEFIKISNFHRIQNKFTQMPSKIVISMPETHLRRQRFVRRYSHLQIPIFDGLRHNVSWLGCGLSYKYLANQFLKSKNTSLIIMEDDVLLPETYEQTEELIANYLEYNSGNWDVFVGLIADLPEGVKILKVEEYAGLQFITLNMMTGMVWNIYSRESLSFLAQWDPHNRDVQTNTIDRYLNSKENLRAVVTLPFLFGHKTDLQSSLWNISNNQYHEMINQASLTLSYLVEEYLNLLTE